MEDGDVPKGRVLRAGLLLGYLPAVWRSHAMPRGTRKHWGFLSFADVDLLVFAKGDSAESGVQCFVLF